MSMTIRLRILLMINLKKCLKKYYLYEKKFQIGGLNVHITYCN